MKNSIGNDSQNETRAVRKFQRINRSASGGRVHSYTWSDGSRETRGGGRLRVERAVHTTAIVVDRQPVGIEANQLHWIRPHVFSAPRAKQVFSQLQITRNAAPRQRSVFPLLPHTLGKA
jgi:hypothetical protein